MRNSFGVVWSRNKHVFKLWEWFIHYTKWWYSILAAEMLDNFGNETVQKYRIYSSLFWYIPWSIFGVNVIVWIYFTCTHIENQCVMSQSSILVLNKGLHICCMWVIQFTDELFRTKILCYSYGLNHDFSSL